MHREERAAQRKRPSSTATDDAPRGTSGAEEEALQRGH